MNSALSQVLPRRVGQMARDGCVGPSGTSLDVKTDGSISAHAVGG